MHELKKSWIPNLDYKYTILIDDVYTSLLINCRYTEHILLTKDINFKYISIDDLYSPKGYTRICLEQVICELFGITHATFYDHRTNQ